jgi:hypothetical protein
VTAFSQMCIRCGGSHGRWQKQKEARREGRLLSSAALGREEAGSIATGTRYHLSSIVYRINIYV